MHKIEDIEVGGVLVQELGGKAKKGAFEILEIDEDSGRITDKLVWLLEEDDAYEMDNIDSNAFDYYEEYLLNERRAVYYPPGKWVNPDDKFNEHRERLINSW